MNWILLLIAIGQLIVCVIGFNVKEISPELFYNKNKITNIPCGLKQDPLCTLQIVHPKSSKKLFISLVTRLSTQPTWFGIGFSKNKTMPGSSGIIIKVDGKKYDIYKGHLIAYAPPIRDSNITLLNVTENDGFTSFLFEEDIVMKNKDWQMDLNECVYVVVVSGDLFFDQVFPHLVKPKFTNTCINLTFNDTDESDPAPSIEPTPPQSADLIEPVPPIVEDSSITKPGVVMSKTHLFAVSLTLDSEFNIALNNKSSVEYADLEAKFSKYCKNALKGSVEFVTFVIENLKAGSIIVNGTIELLSPPNTNLQQDVSNALQTGDLSILPVRSGSVLLTKIDSAKDIETQIPNPGDIAGNADAVTTLSPLITLPSLGNSTTAKSSGLSTTTIVAIVVPIVVFAVIVIIAIILIIISKKKKSKKSATIRPIRDPKVTKNNDLQPTKLPDENATRTKIARGDDKKSKSTLNDDDSKLSKYGTGTVGDYKPYAYGDANEHPPRLSALSVHTTREKNSSDSTDPPTYSSNNVLSARSNNNNSTSYVNRSQKSDDLEKLSSTNFQKTFTTQRFGSSKSSSQPGKDTIEMGSVANKSFAGRARRLSNSDENVNKHHYSKSILESRLDDNEDHALSSKIIPKRDIQRSLESEDSDVYDVNSRRNGNKESSSINKSYKNNY